MTFTLRLNVDLEKFERLMDSHREEMRQAFIRGLDRSAEIVERRAKINLTSNRSVAFGVLRASIGHKTDKDRLRVTIGPGLSARPGGGDSEPQNYGIFVEEGRKPGRAPPLGALDLWVKRKIGIGDDEDVERLAMLIGRKIAREGTLPAPFLVPALKASESAIGVRITTELDRTAEEINSRR